MYWSAVHFGTQVYDDGTTLSSKPIREHHVSGGASRESGLQRSTKPWHRLQCLHRGTASAVRITKY
jgi:hypothetical protein